MAKYQNGVEAHKLPSLYVSDAIIEEELKMEEKHATYTGIITMK